MTRQVIQYQHDAQGWLGRARWVTQPGFPPRTRWTLGFWREGCCRVRFLDLGQHMAELLFQPGMQHGIGHRDDPFGADLSGGGAKEREQFGGASPLILMGLSRWVAFRLPGEPRLRDGLRGPRFIFIQLHDSSSFRLLVGQFDQSFFPGVSGS
jgi:hypothetical protein